MFGFTELLVPVSFIVLSNLETSWPLFLQISSADPTPPLPTMVQVST